MSSDPQNADKLNLSLYLPQYLPDSFYIYTSNQATSEQVSCVMIFLNKKFEVFGKLFKFVTLTLPCFDLGSNMNQ